MTDYISAAEAGRRYGISDKTIRKWVTQGRLRSEERYIDGLRQHAISTDDIEQLLAQRSTTIPEHTGTTILDKMDTLEQRVSALELELQQLRAMLSTPSPQVPTPIVPTTSSPAHIPHSRPASGHHILSNKLPLPLGWANWNNFVERHGLPPSSFDKDKGLYVRSGEEYLQGRAPVKNPMDPAGQVSLLRAGQTRYPRRIHQCDIEGCPCHQLLGQ